MTTATIATLTGKTSAVAASTAYFVTDKNSRGVWMLDADDKTTAHDGVTCVVTKKGQRIKHQDRINTPLKVSWFGIVPSDPNAADKNTAIFNKLRRHSQFVHIVLDVPGVNYYFNHAQDKPFCLDFVDFEGTFDCNNSWVVTEPGYVGLQYNRVSKGMKAKFLNLSLNGQSGMHTEYLRTFTLLPDGTKQFVPFGQANSYSTDWGAYKPNAFNMWGQAYVSNMRLNNYAGTGLCIYADTGVYLSGQEFPVTGVIDHWNGDVILAVDTDEMFDLLGNYSTITVGAAPKEGEQDQRITYPVLNKGSLGFLGERRVALSYVKDDSPAVGSKLVGTGIERGLNLFADSCVFEGINEISNIGGCGVFTTGNEANQSTFANFRIGNTGGPGICDSSLLKNIWNQMHLTASGQHFDGSPGTGAFTNRGDANVGSVIIGMYEEGGNQPISQFGPGTLRFGGTMGNGPGTGGAGILTGGIMHNLYSCDPDGTHQVYFGGGVSLCDEHMHVFTLRAENNQLLLNGKPLLTGDS